MTEENYDKAGEIQRYEKEMLGLCEELGIETTESSDYPTLNGMELTPDIIESIFGRNDTDFVKEGS